MLMPPECQLKNDHLSLSVAPLGAEMQHLRTSAGDDLLWHGDAEFWTGRAPVLFPIVGAAPDDMIATGDHSAPMKQHGFARRSVFALRDHTRVMCRHVLTQSPETLAVYPFDFKIEIIHELVGATLQVTTKITNTGTGTGTGEMPFGFGYHPAFCWPLPRTKGAAHHVTLQNGGAPHRLQLQDGLLDPTPLPSPFEAGDLQIKEALFDDGALVFPNGSSALRYGPKDGPCLEFTFTNLPDLALWKPQNAPFLCIEPWHGTAAHVGDGPQIADRPNSIALAAEQSVEFGYAVTVTL